MAPLKYKVIKNKTQYREYTNILEDIVFSNPNDSNAKDEIELLTLLIEKWDQDHNTFEDLDPIELLKSFMTDHDMKAKDLVELLDISKGYVSDILSYKKGLSKDVIRKLSIHFKVAQETFNRPYKLKHPNKTRAIKRPLRKGKTKLATAV